MFTDGGR